MPEGDTIWRTAARLEPALVGKTLARFEAARIAGSLPKPGTLITAVRAKGKYLLIEFDDGTTLESHMKMTGSWHLYRVGERWRRSARSARAVIETTEGWIAVCFNAPVMELTTRSDGPEHLGPDLTSPDPDLALAAARFSLAEPNTPVAVALLDQRICCGVGNVYKSEVLHACRLSPLTPASNVDERTRLELVTTAHQQLRANLGAGPRTTVPEGLAVYRHAGRPCLRCETPIERIVQGEHQRSTYWCPGCQAESPGRTSPEL